MAHFMLENLEKVNVLGTDLVLIKDEKGNPYVDLTMLCEAIGLDLGVEKDRLYSDPRYGGMQFTVENSEGGAALVGVPLIKLHAFLWNVDLDTVKNEMAGARLAVFQLQCVDILSDYWNKGAAINPNATRGATECLEKRDARRVSRPQLVEACKRLEKYTEGTSQEVSAEDAFNHIIAFCWDKLGRGPMKSEAEALEWGVDQLILAGMELAACTIIDVTIREGYEPNNLLNVMDEELTLKLNEIGERSYELAQ